MNKIYIEEAVDADADMMVWDSRKIPPAIDVLKQPENRGWS